MLLTPSPHDPKKSLLSILMTAFYESSPLARDLYAQLDAYLSNSPQRKEFHLTQALNRVSQFGPPRPDDAAMVPLRADRAYAGMTNDQQQRFFSHVLEFVRHVNYGHTSSGITKAFRFAGLPDNDDMAFLRTQCRKCLPAIARDLRLMNFQEWIIRDYSPAKMASNVVAIRPDIMISALPADAAADALSDRAANESQRFLADQLAAAAGSAPDPVPVVAANPGSLDAKIG